MSSWPETPLIIPIQFKKVPSALAVFHLGVLVRHSGIPDLGWQKSIPPHVGRSMARLSGEDNFQAG
jgi:hypothetical protein